MRGMNMHRSAQMAQLQRTIRGQVGGGIFDGAQATVAPLSAPFISKPTKKRITKRQTKEGQDLEQRVEKI